ncbi:PhzF family phenazine biosynthesis protein [Streptomyces profundus]|uniref:PhzF family phenazine biosynthesis protein n=1 Tax=Streptomyces profundus TaxID=2867410 RepID=UPI001D165F58|nr:PhzF family phenazine biosynthesis protein [Streptomyces sp. MA3_2.13]UED85762.1 PhzF family phenazine biosynthesis protein [Streptomyces sp. MA3_2.13]
MSLSFHIADVFTDRPFGGNQLAVVPGAEGLTDAQLADIAREFNFSETVFVLPPEDPAHSARLRILTPAVELPFAGHPTVGAAAVLVGQQLVDPAATGGVVLFEEGVGLVSVRVDGSYAELTMTAPHVTTDDRPEPRAVAAALSLSESDVLECWFGSVGVPFCYARLADGAAVDRAVLNQAAWAAGFGPEVGGFSSDLYVFAGELTDGARLHARSFIPGMGVVEDPATGAAAAGLVAGVAAGHAAGPGGSGGTLSLTVDQGVAMGRPSVIEASARWRDGELVATSVGGHTVLVASGTLTI